MRRLIALALLVVSMAGFSLAGASPAAATGKDFPVRAGNDDCGNFQIWVNGEPTIYYLVCNPTG